MNVVLFLEDTLPQYGQNFHYSLYSQKCKGATVSLGLMGIPLVGNRRGIILALHVLNNLFRLECDISILCKEKIPSFVHPSCGKN